VAERVAELESFDERASRLDAERRRALDAAATTAADVRSARVAAAPRLAAAITRALTALAMPHAVVEVHVDGAGPGDDVEFRLAANPGSPPLPFAKVASGGELARTMLALRLVMVDHSAPAAEQASTLVFDEVDAGIGGIAATAVGRALAAVGSSHQVLVVTHLPQVAAAATTQISVTKSVAGAETTAVADVISGNARVNEIARMLSGEVGGDAAQRHARELLARASAP
jgi:DNA repair protein RecN (Recombination protein N)